MTESTPSPSPSAPSLDELAEQKQAAYNEVGKAVAAYKATLRTCARYESQISAYLIGINRRNEAVKNLISEASLLVRADEYAEAASVYRKALDCAYTEELQHNINAAIIRMEEAANTLKVAKPVQPIIDLVGRLQGEIINAQEGGPSTEKRFVEFNVMGKDNDVTKFRVECSTVYRVTNDFDSEGYDVTTVERVEERVNDALAKAAIAERAEAEQDEADFEDEDDDDSM